MDSDKRAKEAIKELKGLVRSQSKELSQLRKELDRREDVAEDYRELLNEREDAPKLSKTAPRCPECGKGIKETELGRVTLIKCSNCNWRTTRK